MTPYVITAPAKRDLIEIWDFIAMRDGVDRADRVLRKIEVAVERIASMPGIGHQRDELSDISLRVWAEDTYLLIFRPGAVPLEIIRVLHGARDLDALVD